MGQEIDGVLSPADLRRIQERYRLRQADLERMPPIGPKRWTSWKRGKGTRSKAADTLIWRPGEDPEVARRLMAHAGIGNPGEAICLTGGRAAR